jgi:hypothetical protein
LSRRDFDVFLLGTAITAAHDSDHFARALRGSAIEELETALEGYAGCLVVVTHDRRFLARLNVTRTIGL